MAVQISWLVEGKVLLNTHPQILTMDDLQAANVIIKAHLDAAQNPIHTIVDASQVEKYPLDIRSIVASMPNIKHTNAGIFIVVGGGENSLRFVASLVSQLIGIKMHTCKTQAEAMAILVKADPSLNV
jgi:hypothetical protein